MFAIEKIQAGLKGLVAVRQPLNPDVDILDASQYAASSGLYLDDVEHFRLDYWIDGQSYAKADNDDLQDLWDQLEQSSIANIMARVFNKPSYIDRNLIYSNTFDRNELIDFIPDPERFYGYEIRVSDKKNIAFKITTVRIEAIATDGETLTLNLYHSSQAEPIKTKDIILTNNGTLQIEQLDWVIDNSDNYYKGQFYIGFTKPSYSFQPYARNFNVANVPNEITELYIRPIEHDGDFESLEDMFYASEHNGLNFDITTYYDYTDMILQNKFIFAEALKLQWAMQILLMGISSNRSNRNERAAKDLIQILLVAVEGQSGFGISKVTGIKQKLAGEIDRLQGEVQSIINGYFTQQITMSTVC